MQRPQGLGIGRGELPQHRRGQPGGVGDPLPAPISTTGGIASPTVYGLAGFLRAIGGGSFRGRLAGDLPARNHFSTPERLREPWGEKSRKTLKQLVRVHNSLQ